ncbi:MAG: hypothetical protein ACUZ8I_05380, partial [Candidatus Scalindua sp.]
SGPSGPHCCGPNSDCCDDTCCETDFLKCCPGQNRCCLEDDKCCPDGTCATPCNLVDGTVCTDPGLWPLCDQKCLFLTGCVEQRQYSGFTEKSCSPRGCTNPNDCDEGWAICVTITQCKTIPFPLIGICKNHITQCDFSKNGICFICKIDPEAEVTAQFVDDDSCGG